MASKNINLDIDNFLQMLLTENNKQKRAQMCSNKRKELEDSYTIRTVKTYLTEYRAAIKTTFGEDSTLLRFLRISKAKTAKIKREYKNKIQKRTEEGALQEITNPQELITLGRDLIKESSYLKVSLGLMLLTGRRTIEVLKTGSLHPISKKSFEVVFEGQAKKGDKESLPYKIPTLAPAKELISALNWLRETKGELLELTEKQVSSKCARNLNNLCGVLFFDTLGSNSTPHDLRKAYAALAYEQSGKKESFRIFAAKILGHSSDSTETTETYFKYQITNY